MKSKKMIEQYEKLSCPLMQINRKEFSHRVKEYIWLSRNVYNLSSNPKVPISVVFAGKYVYVDRLKYIELLKDIGVLRYKYARKKYKRGIA